MNSPSFLKYVGYRNVHTDEQATAYINERVMKSYDEHGYGAYVMILKSTGESVGNCGIFKRPALDHPDVGYSLLPRHEGKGYAFEATSAVMEMARDFKLRKLYAITVPYNERSIHLLKKLGLSFEKNFWMEGDPEELCLYGMELDYE